MSRTSQHGKLELQRHRVFAVIAALGIVMASVVMATSAQAAPSYTPVPAIPASITFSDPCDPGNATWDSIPAGADYGNFEFDFDYSSQPYHLLVTDTLPLDPPFQDHVAGNDHVHDYGLPPDSGDICFPPEPTITNPPGPNNATWDVPANDSTFNWSVDGNGHLIVTIVAANTRFSDGTTTYDFGVAPDPDQSGGSGSGSGSGSSGSSGGGHHPPVTTGHHGVQPPAHEQSSQHKPTSLPDTGWSTPASVIEHNGQSDVPYIVAAVLLALGLGSGGLGVAIRRRRDGA